MRLVGTDGTSYAVWQDSRNGNADIYFSKLTSGGSGWSANVKVSDDPGTAAQTAPRIGIDSAGTLTVICAMLGSVRPSSGRAASSPGPVPGPRAPSSPTPRPGRPGPRP